MSVFEDRLQQETQSQVSHNTTPFYIDVPWPLSVRALNNDNQVEAAKLVRLLQTYYGDRAPFEDAFSTEYWCRSRSPESMAAQPISIVAEDGDTFVAHIALERDPQSGTVQVLLPAIDPAYRSQILKIIPAFWNTIELQARRQGWRMIYGISLGIQPILQMMSAKRHQAEAVAILPVPRNTTFSFDPSEPHTHSAHVVMMSVLNHENSDQVAIYPPAQHLETIRTLYAGIGLKRQIVETPTVTLKAKVTTDTASPSGTGRFRRFVTGETTVKGVCGRSLPRFGAYQLKICTGALSDMERTLTFVQRIEQHRTKQNQKLHVHVALDDPGCPEFCAHLEQLGYSFCGVLPMFPTRDYVVFAKLSQADISGIPAHSTNAKVLREYLHHPAVVN